MPTKIRWSSQVNLDGDINLDDQYHIINVPDPVNATDVANKKYIDLLAQGIKWKEPCRVATTGEITLSGIQTIDGVSVNVGDRVLVKDQTTNATQNGIYVVASDSWSRAEDANEGSELHSAAVFIDEGNTYAHKGFVCTTTPPIILGSSNITFVNFTTSGSIIGGLGIIVNGTEVSVNADTSRAIGVDANGVYAKVKNQGGILIDPSEGLYLDREKAYLLADAYRQSFIGDGSTKEFTLYYTPYFLNDYANFNIIVTLNGVVQTANDDYTVDSVNKKISFTYTPVSGDKIQVYYVKQE
jgi:hypothetical protein